MSTKLNDYINQFLFDNREDKMTLAYEITNYVESVLNKKLDELGYYDLFDLDQIADISCIVLNRIPGRYYCHRVDLLMFMSLEEQDAMDAQVEEQVIKAKELILKPKKNANEQE